MPNMFHAEDDVQQLLPATLLGSEKSLGVMELQQVLQAVRQSVSDYLLPLFHAKGMCVCAAGPDRAANQVGMLAV